LKTGARGELQGAKRRPLSVMIVPRWDMVTVWTVISNTHCIALFYHAAALRGSRLLVALECVQGALHVSVAGCQGIVHVVAFKAGEQGEGGSFHAAIRGQRLLRCVFI